MKQNDQILQHLKRRPITPLEALNLYGILRLGARIWDLRQSGVKIKSQTVAVKNRAGKDCHVKRYSLA